ncbi:hypothetical protein HGRIS_006626 [Hohenbuehelia grisea]|uniref:F-box domain-containing protein n=1 Tax=Hohenbuehelia grisea TaxID=104357 RepID=A0ABR3JAM6_9AGAR
MTTTQAGLNTSKAEPDNQCFLLRLPTEIIANVFIHTLPKYRHILPNAYTPADTVPFPHPMSAPLLLTNLCRRLTQIAWSTPILWSCLAISVGLPEREPSVDLSALQRWLGRAGAHPLTLRIIVASYQQELIETIMSTSARWKSVSIRVSCQPEHLVSMGSWAHGGFPLLENLVVRGRLSRSFILPLSAAPDVAPRLTKLLVTGGFTPPFRLPLGNLRELELNNCAIQELLTMLPHTPSLESLTLVNTEYLPPGNPIFQFTLPCLRRLIINGNFWQDGLVFLVQGVIAPVLEHLSCSLPGSLHPRLIFDVFKRLFQKSDCYITSFSLYFPTAKLDDIIPFLKSTSSIQSLELECDEAASDALFLGLTWDPSRGAGSMLLPHLSSLSLKPRWGYSQFNPLWFDMLQSRTGVDRFPPISATEPAHLRAFGIRTAVSTHVHRQVEEFCMTRGIDLDLRIVGGESHNIHSPILESSFL